MFRFLFIILLFIYANASMTKEQISTYIKSPLKLGEKDINIPVWEILDENNKLNSYIFETFDYAPIAGFSGG